MTFLLRSFTVALTLTAFTSAADYFPPPDSKGGWRTLGDAKEIRAKAGLDLLRLQDAYKICENTTPNGGLLVVRHGWLVFEKYFGRASRNANPDMASTGKAYTSIACGIMLNEFRDKIPRGSTRKSSRKNTCPRHSRSTIRARPTSRSASFSP